MDMLIDGEWVKGNSYYGVRNPADGSLVDKVPEGSSRDVDRAVNAAAKAFETYSRMPHSDRREAMLKIGSAITARAKELAPTLTREQGKPLDQATLEIVYAGMLFEQFAEMAPIPETLKEGGGVRLFTVPQPIGVCALIIPWNFPVAVMVWKLAPALLTGNTVVIKPSPYTPLTELTIAKICSDHLPKGVVNVVTGGDAAGKALTKHPLVRKIAFTGHVDTGPKIVGAAGSKRLSLELGGNDAALALCDFDFALMETLHWCVFKNAGQICTAIKRIYVHESIYEKFVGEFIKLTKNIKVGNGLEPGIRMGPLNNKGQFDKVNSLVKDAVKRGAKVECGGAPLSGKGYDGGYFYAPTVLTGCKDEWPIVAEEQFGPAIPILPFKDLEEVIKRANATRYGLGGSVWTRDTATGVKVAERLVCGIAWVNNHGLFDTLGPFGGTKDSGFGKELGAAGVEEYVLRKTMHVKM